MNGVVDFITADECSRALFLGGLGDGVPFSSKAGRWSMDSVLYGPFIE
jgi:hypothetical protein